ncbi:MAG: hypothetical protein IPM13_17925, partial [Phycisphaerales bacterium]|nr:hypothetical protein [Phycisphaerales bacterium]
AWQPRDAGSGEELRRLYYVAMTRARQTLTLVQADEGARAAWLPSLQGDAVHRTRVHVPADSRTAPRMRYELLSQADLWLAYAGRNADHARMADAIARLATGDPLRLASTPGRLFVANLAGERIAALSAKGSERWRPRLPSIVDLRVAAILVRRRQDETAEYQAELARDAWCVVIPEVRYNDAADG